MKKVTRKMCAGVLLAFSAAGIAACGSTNNGSYGNIKVGLILLHPAATSTYDKNFRDAMEAAQKKMGFTLVVKENVGEDDNARIAASEMAEDGCDVVFADSFGHEDYIIQAAQNYPEVTFCHATGVRSQETERGSDKIKTPIKNYHNAFAAIYEGRYLAGVAAGQRMMEDIEAKKYTDEEAKIGYVGAHPYAEVISGFTSFYLGARSVCPSVTMEVRYTGSWYDYDGELATAKTLIANNCKLISQHADSYGAPKACEDDGIPNVAYNGPTDSAAPETYLVCSKINWQPYFEHMVECVSKGTADTELERDYVGTFANDSVQLGKFGKNVTEVAKQKVADAKKAIVDGTLHVFDTSKFTINGEAPNAENVKPGLFTYTDYPEGTDFLKDGYYHESEYRSAPSFDIIIDGITSITE